MNNYGNDNTVTKVFLCDVGGVIGNVAGDRAIIFNNSFTNDLKVQ